MQIDPNLVSVSFLPSDDSLPLALLVNGEPEKVDEERAKQIVSADEVTILIDLGGVGDASATYWTCDLSHVSLLTAGCDRLRSLFAHLTSFSLPQEYVTINGDYRR
jgi:N-acetylglutamate synthase/N-acetylornithine aminotransferase